ncbi:uncharacterized protein A4U43_C02F17070 [Asparagus officinalis]|uniref:Tubby C-terminal domain-containing protein n=1 Tax=Asparagus officinalis TaxID=4686 RepID=A0A5P1FNV3_ASPOF|nr:protein LURP-one-related 12-like [Asparagus officinalis]ONK78310.1 uncharacterized protein A4U43_C02F17070 [Asparagus officinalis]
MGRIHPAKNMSGDGESSVWTVWKKSSMAFQGTDGFSVYNDKGKLAFRLDNYSRKHKELVLMDGGGKPLLSLRPQILSIHDQWNGFKESEEDSKTRSKSNIFSIKRKSILHSTDEVEVFMTNGITPDFQVEGCFWKRNCKIRSKSGEIVAKTSRKKVNKSVILSDDVFSLEIRPGIDCELIMAFVVVLDRICQKPHATLMCS